MTDEGNADRETGGREALTLESVHNFRDVAGDGYALASGGRMARGLVYRGPALTPGEGDAARLDAVGFSCVVDLGTESEGASQPDVVPDGARHVHVDVLGGEKGAVTFHSDEPLTAEVAEREMLRTYESFVTGPAERAAWGTAVSEVARSVVPRPTSAGGPVIIHCTAGKDRTGWLSAILQLLAGANEDDVMADYLLTNELSVDFVERLRAWAAAEMPDQVEAMLVLARVRELYLRTALDALAREYGDVRTYLVDGAGVHDEAVDALAARLRGE